MKRTYTQYIRNHPFFAIVPIGLLVCAAFAFYEENAHLGHGLIHVVWVIAFISIFDFRRWKKANEKTDNATGTIK